MTEEIKFEFIKEKTTKRTKNKRQAKQDLLIKSKTACNNFVSKDKFVTTLIQILDDKGISKSVVADSINISAKTLYYWLDENEENLPNLIETAFKLNRFLETNVEYYKPDIFFADNNCYQKKFLDLQKFKIQYEQQKQIEKSNNYKLKELDDFLTQNNLTLSIAEEKILTLKKFNDLLQDRGSFIGLKYLNLIQNDEINKAIRNLHINIKNQNSEEIQKSKQQLADVFETYITHIYNKNIP